MSTTTSARARSENADAVGLVVALLVRFAEIATISAHPTDGTIVLSFVIRRRLDRASRSSLRDALVEHVRTLHAIAGWEARVLGVTCEVDDGITFARVTRDAASLSRDELVLLTGLFAERFGEALLCSALDVDAAEDEAVPDDELVDYAIEALRDPSLSKSLVGFREEKRVLVYFSKARKKTKTAGRS
ncbi:MAG: hypothetical protein ABI346_02705 [Candidatus Baltobacteraceae bacterium]